MTAAGFWGLLIEPGKMYSQAVPASFKVTMASLGPEVVDGSTSSSSSSAANTTGRTTVMLRIEDQDDYAICSLTPGKLEQQPLDLSLKEGENIAFRVSGPFPIHLTGYYVDSHEHDHDDEEDDYESGSDMAEEVEGEYDSEDESQYDSEEAEETVRKIMKSKKARKAAAVVDTESESEDDDGNLVSEDSDEEGVSVGSGDSDDEEIDSEDFEDMSEDDFIDDGSEDEEEDDDEDEEEEEDESEEDEEIVPQGKRSNAPTKNQPEAKKTKTDSPKAAQPEQPATAKKTDSPKPKQPVAADTNKKENTAPNTTTANTKKPDQPNKPQEQSEKKPVTKTLPSGLILEDITVGNGQKVVRDRRVGISYIGRLQSGKVFDQSKGKDLLWFNVGRGEVVKGMDIGVQGMAVGGKRRLTIPAALAYGNASLPGIPANSTLVFEVTVEKMTGGK